MTLTELKENCIFRYRKFNKNTKKEVTNFNIWHSNIEGLNDPFEFPITLNWDKLHSKDKSILVEYALKYNILNRTELCKMLMDEKNHGVEHIYRVIMENLDRSALALNDYINTLLVCCFSENMESPLMWSHYADGMRGVCIAYNKESFVKNDNFDLQSVEYNPRPIEFNHGDLTTTPIINEFKSYDFKNSENILSEGRLVRLKSQRYLLQKHMSWEYEREVRNIIDPNARVDGMLVPFPKSAIKAIIVGSKMSLLNARMTLRFCKKNHLSMFVAHPDKTNYKVNIEKIIV